jgi:hypothetical protein
LQFEVAPARRGLVTEGLGRGTREHDDVLKGRRNRRQDENTELIAKETKKGDYSQNIK